MKQKRAKEETPSNLKIQTAPRHKHINNCCNMNLTLSQHFEFVTATHHILDAYLLKSSPRRANSSYTDIITIVL